jgi:dTMP kinase
MKYKVKFEIDFKRNPYKGTYIALEGTESAGKTTQAKKLTQYFESQGRKVVKTREPQKQGLIGDIVHKVLMGEIKMDPIAFQYLISADRVLNLEQIVMPALKNGDVVISDRCFWSAIVYGVLDKVGSFNQKAVNQFLVAQSLLSFYHQFIVPDFTFYLRVPLNVSVKRLEFKKNKEIYENKEKVKQLIEGYDWVTEQFPKEFTIIDGTKSIDEISSEIISKI